MLQCLFWFFYSNTYRNLTCRGKWNKSLSMTQIFLNLLHMFTSKVSKTIVLKTNIVKQWNEKKKKRILQLGRMKIETINNFGIVLQLN